MPTRKLMPLLAVLTLSACELDILGSDGRGALPSGLATQLTVAPSSVAPHAQFTVEVTVTNTTADTITVVSPESCLVLPHVMRDGRRVPVRGSAVGCLTAVTPHVFPPGGSRVIAWQMRAELYAEQAGDVDGAPAPRGAYRVRAEFPVLRDDRIRRSAIERSLRVE